MTLRLDQIEIFLTQIPLKIPYDLSFGPVRHFDTILVRVVLDNGAEGWGEATVLEGYTDETPESAWITAQSLAPHMHAQTVAAAQATAQRASRSKPFTATAFLTALEMAGGSHWLKSDEPLSMPLLATLKGRTSKTLGPEVDALLAKGYQTLKFKVGFDLDDDLAALDALQGVVAGRARIRVDANQGYSLDQARTFLREMRCQDIELMEQPCQANDWSAAQALAPVAKVPLMLDESIYDEADIERAGHLGCADFIKLKLMKFGSLDRLAEALQLIESLGMTAVLGNGVAAEPGCWMEACIGARLVRTAGEMNGFLKTSEKVFSSALRVEAGSIVVDPHLSLAPDVAALQRVTFDRLRLGPTVTV